MKKYITRHLEEKIKDNIKKCKCLALLGARQVGKSTLLTNLFPNYKKINMMDPQLQKRAIEAPTTFLQNYKTPLIIDEIQEAPYLLASIKVLMDDTLENGNYILSGSQKWQMMKGLSDSLAGIISIEELATLSLREIYNINFHKEFDGDENYLIEREKHIIKYENLWDYIHKGFYPEVYNDRDWEKYYSDYIKTYLERDVYKIINIKNPNTFYKFMICVAARTGSILNINNIAEEIGVKSDTVSSWIGILEKTNIVYLLQPYYSSCIKKAIKSQKIYFRDTGLCAFLTGWFTSYQLENGSMSGAFFETFVVNEIIKSYSNNSKDYKPYIYYYRNREKYKDADAEHEIDLLIEKNGIIYPIEIKKTTNPQAIMAKSFIDLDKISNKKRGNGLIICCCNEKIKLRDNLYAIPVEYI